MAQKDLDWITPLLGFVGLLAGTLFFTGNQSTNNNSSSSNNLPPPPPNAPPAAKPCGCQAGKK
jgi:hypothetical protein